VSDTAVSRQKGRPRLNPDVAYERARVTWVYAPGQLERLTRWALKLGIHRGEAIRRAVDRGLAYPFAPDAVSAPEGRRVGQAPVAATGKSKHTKWIPRPGQLAAIDALAAQHGISRNAVMRALVEHVLLDVVGPGGRGSRCRSR
jgi:hypothetical protein